MDSEENTYQAVPKEIVEQAIEKAKNIESIDEAQQDTLKKIQMRMVEMIHQ